MVRSAGLGVLSSIVSEICFQLLEEIKGTKKGHSIGVESIFEPLQLRYSKNRTVGFSVDC
jgi:hypothetical protein